ncbi:MAG TPA: hypothetical protein ACQGQH_01700 [Xylella sp.]
MAITLPEPAEIAKDTPDYPTAIATDSFTKTTDADDNHIITHNEITGLE